MVLAKQSALRLGLKTHSVDDIVVLQTQAQGVLTSSGNKPPMVFAKLGMGKSPFLETEQLVLIRIRLTVFMWRIP